MIVMQLRMRYLGRVMSWKPVNTRINLYRGFYDNNLYRLCRYFVTNE